MITGDGQKAGLDVKWGQWGTQGGHPGVCGSWARGFTHSRLIQDGVHRACPSVSLRTGDEWMGQAPAPESPLVGIEILLFNHLPGILVPLEFEGF